MVGVAALVFRPTAGPAYALDEAPPGAIDMSVCDSDRYSKNTLKLAKEEPIAALLFDNRVRTHACRCIPAAPAQDPALELIFSFS